MDSIEDITGAIDLLEWELESDEPEFDLGEQFDRIIDSLTAKIARIKNAIRKTWFTNALNLARESRAIWQVDRERALELLAECEDVIYQGNKIHLRKTGFVVGEDGEITDVRDG